MQPTRTRTDTEPGVGAPIIDLRSESGGLNAQLHRVVGRWTTQGLVIGDPAVSITGTDTYEVHSGGFLVHHVEQVIGVRQVRAVEIIGEPDTHAGGFLARSFDETGQVETLRLVVDEDGVFHFSGDLRPQPGARPSNPPFLRVRATLVVADDRQSMMALWERSSDGRTWNPWKDVGYRRAA